MRNCDQPKICYMFTEGDTEWDYLDKFSKPYRNKIRFIRIGQISDPATLATRAIGWLKCQKFDKKELERNQAWLLFDNDNRPDRVKEAFRLVKEYNIFNKMRKRKSLELKIAYMSPCIEIWPLMHFTNSFSDNRHRLQSELHTTFMRRYHHSNNPYFDLSVLTPEGLNAAMTLAKQWEISLSGEEELNASRYAGIFKIIEEIQTA